METVRLLTVLALVASVGVSVVLWSVVGLLRRCTELVGDLATAPSSTDRSISGDEVAVVVPAHNEEDALPACLAALSLIVSPSQVYVASDGSSDRTVKVARAAGCHANDLRPNGGKARAIAAAIARNKLCSRYKAILIQDADSVIDPNYLRYALPLFDDPKVVTVAGHVLSRWPSDAFFSWAALLAAYRTRLYWFLQATLQYGQSAPCINVSYIAPGFASMHRASALAQIEIAARGLVIEDFNITFEVHRKKLGRVAYSPKVRCSTEDPLRLSDYRKQVSRWSLGFWQTVLRHGIWPGKFWASLSALLVELIAFSTLLLLLPFLIVAGLICGATGVTFSIHDVGAAWISPTDVGLLFVLGDFAVTIAAAIASRRFQLLFYGLAFPFLRFLDSYLFLAAFFRSLRVQSDGRWVSPGRHDSRVPSIGKLDSC